MAEFDFAESGLSFHIEQKYQNELYIPGFAGMMKDPSYCYKFYWLEAIVKLISTLDKYNPRTVLTFDEIIDEMISNAWYSVREFHVHLSGLVHGEVKDGLERTILALSKLCDLPSNASKTEIKNAIKEHNKEIHAEKVQLTHMVPYRALASFFAGAEEKPNWDSAKQMVSYIARINQCHQVLPYTIGPSSQLNREVYLDPTWIQMIQDNTVAILGWIQYEKTKWLQMNNPEVPGLVYKLAPLDDKMRKLSHVRKLWEAVLEVAPVRDIYTKKEILSGAYDVDHFIPWSFVMNDELWNLIPTDSSVNSSKSNRLPQWDLFFGPFAQNQFLLYGLVTEEKVPHKLFENCYKDNLHSIWADKELYRPGNTRAEFCTILEKNMRPVYDSALRQGYDLWVRG